jgi:hypothetical protein
MREVAAADCVVIITDHQEVDYESIVKTAQLVVDTRNATRGIEGGVVVGLSGERPRGIGEPRASYVAANA